MMTPSKPQMQPPTPSRQWLRLLIATQVSLFLVAGQVSCTSKKTQSDDDSGASQSLDVQQTEGDFADPAQASGDAVNDQLAAEELGAGSQSLEPQSNSVANDLAMSDPSPAAKAPEPQVSAEPPRAANDSSSGGQSTGNFKGNFSEVAITEIKYLSKRSGGTVVVETSAPATYHTREVAGQNQVVMEIANAQLPDRLKRPYVTKDFGQEITSVMAYQDKGSTTVRVVVQFKSPHRADVQQDGRTLMLASADSAGVDQVSDNPTLGDSGGDSPMLTDSEENPIGAAASNDGPTPARAFNDRDPRILPAQSADAGTYDNVRFYGRPISIEVRDTPVRDVINLIAEQSGANIVLAGEVDGSISLKLRKIPWDQALLIVMKTRNLGYVRQGSILRVAPYESLQKETEAAKRVVDAQKAAEPLRVKVIPVGYAKVAELKPQIDAFLSEKRGKCVADARTNSLVITDTPDVLERIGNLIKVLDLPPLQVLIEGKVVEARETFGRDFGIKWGFSGQGVNFGTKQATTDFSSNMGVPAAGGVANFRIGQFDIFGDINAQLGLAEREDQVKIISSPRIVALNNEQATITQGTNIATYQTNQANGVTTTSVSYTEVPMKLEVTPQVTSENDVIMQINIKRDFAGARLGTQAPDINKREAKTKVLVRNGQTAVVGGVYQSDSNESEGGIPWLRSLPVVGWLFKSRSVSSEKTELLVFLTPRILNADTSLQKESSL